MLQAIKSGSAIQAGVCSSVILARALNAASLSGSDGVEDIIVAAFVALAGKVDTLLADSKL